MNLKYRFHILRLGYCLNRDLSGFLVLGVLGLKLDQAIFKSTMFHASIKISPFRMPVKYDVAIIDFKIPELCLINASNSDRVKILSLAPDRLNLSAICFNSFNHGLDVGGRGFGRNTAARFNQICTICNSFFDFGPDLLGRTLG